ncbi:hypothetical protein BB560_004230 [Smittium megazygosporum]|uniref:Golgi apparatus membrane protein TVP18 n=1 Tax=Smittium megazygosporum TaxID=133381 RepID=A0A2T9Z9V9_9FUNG|nr:hypothetical protein BB560_004230 [Smittium megazygosporum]
MSFPEELKSRNFSIYAQISGLISAVFLLVFALINISHQSGFRALAIIFAVVVLVIEISVIARLIPSNDSMERFFGGKKRNWWRFVLYLVFAIIMWVAVSKDANSLGVGAFFLTISALLYLLAGITGQESISLSILGGSGIETQS